MRVFVIIIIDLLAIYMYICNYYFFIYCMLLLSALCVNVVSYGQPFGTPSCPNPQICILPSSPIHIGQTVELRYNYSISFFSLVFKYLWFFIFYY